MEIDMNQTSKMPVSDDPELAKILSGVSGSSDNSDDNQNTDELQYEDLNLSNLSRLQYQALVA